MLRRIRARLALRRVERLRGELRDVPPGDVPEALGALAEARERWLRLDGRERISCPRRSMIGGHRTGGPDYWRDDGTCSYCGSLSPDEFLEAAGAGAEVIPTDKNYKAYIDLPNPEADKRVPRGSSNGDERPGEDWVGRPGDWTLMATQPVLHHKLYFQHLSHEERERFVTMLNDGTMRVGYPGRFYRQPFFVAPRDPRV